MDSPHPMVYVVCARGCVLIAEFPWCYLNSDMVLFNSSRIPINSGRPLGPNQIAMRRPPWNVAHIHLKTLTAMAKMRKAKNRRCQDTMVIMMVMVML